MAGWQANNAYSLIDSQVSVISKDDTEEWEEKSEDSPVDVELPQVVSSGIGLLPADVYDRQLHPWATRFRRWILKNLAWESEVLAAMQVCSTSFSLGSLAEYLFHSARYGRRSWTPSLSILHLSERIHSL